MVAHARGLAWRRWQERRRLHAILRLLRFQWWLDVPRPITLASCCTNVRGRWRGEPCSAAAPDPDHLHRWEDVLRARRERAVRLQGIHGLCGCRRCCGHLRRGRYLTKRELWDRVNVHEQAQEETIKSDCLLTALPRGRT